LISLVLDEGKRKNLQATAGAVTLGLGTLPLQQPLHKPIAVRLLQPLDRLWRRRSMVRGGRD
jgi:hypothetical protein